MQSILELVWYFFYPNSPEPDWFSVTACDVPSQTSVTELNIGQTSLISPILPTDCDLFLSNCSLLSHISVTPTGLAICSHHLHLIIGLHLIHCWLTCFFTKLKRLSTLCYYVTAYNKQRDFKPKYSKGKLYCIQGIYKLTTIIKIFNKVCIYTIKLVREII